LYASIEEDIVIKQNLYCSKNKFMYVYLLMSKGIAEKVALTTRFLSLKMEEY